MFKFKYLIASALILSSGNVFASESVHYKDINWPFEGALGQFDKKSVQRGYQVYKEVCASCHSMKYMSFRNLSQIGFEEAEIKAIAAGYKVQDGPDDAGDMFEREGRPSDKFPKPFANEKAARAANGGAYPPDLSLMVKARANGADYLYSLLTGYEEVPSGIDAPAGKSYNKYFPGHFIAMPNPLSEGRVEYMDGTTASVDQMSKDIVNFLQWAAEPEMEDRKRIGIKSMIFLSIFTVLFFLSKKIIWRRVK